MTHIRTARIAAELSPFAGSGAIPFIGDSHMERMSLVYGQGNHTINGHPVVFAGIAGAHWGNLYSDIPWASIHALNPTRIVLCCGVNDANSSVGFDAGNNVDTFWWQTIMQGVINQCKIKDPNTLLVTSPPPESAAGVNAYRNHQIGRIQYYLATGAIGSVSPLPFLDLHYDLAVAPKTPVSSAYSNPCYAAAGSTMDQVHEYRSVYEDIMARITAAL